MSRPALKVPGGFFANSLFYFISRVMQAFDLPQGGKPAEDWWSRCERLLRKQSTMKHSSLAMIVGLAFSAAAATPQRQPGVPYSYSIIPEPSSFNLAVATGINNEGQIVGFSGFHGFLLSHGVYAILDAPGAKGMTQSDGTVSPGSTICNGINDQGQIVGYFYDGNGPTHGFFYKHGGYTTLDVPGSLPGTTRANGINSHGDIVGQFTDSSGHGKGFLLSHDVYTTISAPNADISTIAEGVNDQGQIVGNATAWSTPEGFPARKWPSGGISGPGFGGYTHGFLFSHGVYTTLYSPNKGDSNFRIRGINNKGQIVGSCGYFVGDKLLTEGFLLIGGVYTLLDAPSHEGNTDANGINDKGQIVGTYSERTIEAVSNSPNDTVSILHTKICLWKH